MEKIIEAVGVELIKSELNEQSFLRKTNKAGNEIYVVDAHQHPHTMREIGRLREIAFRSSGGGTGKEVDIDEFDTMENPCKQLIVWNPDTDEIIGGYRYITGKNIQMMDNGQPKIATSHLFHFSDKFIKDYLPNTLELGRSFVRLEYQSSSAGAKSLFALDNLWDGLGALSVENPDVKYFFGKVTMYPSFGTLGRDMILYFLNKFFGDKEKLVTPIRAIKIENDVTEFDNMLNADSQKDNYKTLNQEVRALGLNIPPLVSAYMNLSETMKVFGTAINDEFGEVEETGILITAEDIYEDKKSRHIETYVKTIVEDMQLKKFNIS